MPKKKEKEQGVAEDLFINQGWEGKAIADLLGVREQTVSKWRTEGGWDDQRDETLAAPHKIAQLILKEMKSVSEGNAPKLDADNLIKLGKTLEGLREKTTNPQTVISVLKGLDEFIAESNPALAVQNLEFHKKYIIHLINLNG